MELHCLHFKPLWIYVNWKTEIFSAIIIQATSGQFSLPRKRFQSALQRLRPCCSAEWLLLHLHASLPFCSFYANKHLKLFKKHIWNWGEMEDWKCDKDLFVLGGFVGGVSLNLNNLFFFYSFWAVETSKRPNNHHCSHGNSSTCFKMQQGLGKRSLFSQFDV